jgi:hypothetical protein
MRKYLLSPLHIDGIKLNNHVTITLRVIILSQAYVYSESSRHEAEPEAGDAENPYLEGSGGAGVQLLYLSRGGNEGGGAT